MTSWSELNMGISQVSTTLNGNPKTLATGITYLPYGGITGLTYGNGLSLTQGYDNQYRTSSIVTGSILNLAYGYDPNGNIISILDTVTPPGGEVFDPPGTYTYQTGTNKLTHIEGTPPIGYGYDANGNITTENTEGRHRGQVSTNYKIRYTLVSQDRE